MARASDLIVHRLTFYTRVNCHLCEQALAAVARVRQVVPCDLELVDLDTEATADKLKAYDVEVPVVELDGRKVMKYRVDEDRLLRLLKLA